VLPSASGPLLQIAKGKVSAKRAVCTISVPKLSQGSSKWNKHPTTCCREGRTCQVSTTSLTTISSILEGSTTSTMSSSHSSNSLHTPFPWSQPFLCRGVDRQFASHSPYYGNTPLYNPVGTYFYSSCKFLLFKVLPETAKLSISKNNTL